ncbi:protein phosphatase 2C domain-containing protein [filamentous cyanobacterium LEGE 11480]|uniref:Protein phosphatase 2C domain-containing protein n=1 Tax=Romeriopsis navalis LEGE 11480 TaxID=2777977 RepID=A0A928VMB2_9CYAN|nr:protein phosphatase 2C domain-containing protein [Romeriopsis navalis]MBE9031176.1 protein phosphatase 2C domain-containing protein [Romeriopsis navalis LEGE 11480]
MNRLEPQIACVNPNCDRPSNRLNAKVCAACGTEIERHYVWAVGDNAAKKKLGTTAGNARYYVCEPNIWLDLEPSEPPTQYPEVPEELLPYLYLYPQRFNLPEIYGISIDGRGQEVLLLDNAPISADGKPLPPILERWNDANATRQVYWLYQIATLWAPLQKWNMLGSLLDSDLMRVQSWRLRLQELQPSHPSVDLSDLAGIWRIWLPEAKPALAPVMSSLIEQMQAGTIEIAEIVTQLNHLLLQQAAQSPLRLQAYGATDTGKARSHNEDACYPVGKADVQDELTARLSIVCDGIGGHEGGEVASQMALRLLRPQMQALINEVGQETDVIAPTLIAEQMQSIARVVNNVISNENDDQARESRRRMGTTLVLALQLPQRVKLPSGAVSGNAHELYVMGIGDSRVYWLTPQACHQLTVDDDVAAREVKMGRMVYADAMQRPDGGALTQALGMRDGEYLRPNVYRYVLEEDGLLLLCSDGLSDRDLVEKYWSDYTEPVLRGQMPLEQAVNGWIQLANEKNGTDNISVVLTRVEVSVKPELVLNTADDEPDPEVDESDLAELSAEPPETAGEDSPAPAAALTPKRRLGWLWFFLLCALAGGGIFAWSQLDPASFNPARDRVETQIQRWRQQIEQQINPGP